MPKHTSFVLIELSVLSAIWRYFFCGSFVFFMSCVCHAFASVHCCLVATCWEMADLLALVVFCRLRMWYPGSGVVLDCIDSCFLPPFLLCRLLFNLEVSLATRLNCSCWISLILVRTIYLQVKDNLLFLRFFSVDNTSRRHFQLAETVLKFD